MTWLQRYALFGCRGHLSGSPLNTLVICRLRYHNRIRPNLVLVSPPSQSSPKGGRGGMSHPLPTVSFTCHNAGTTTPGGQREDQANHRLHRDHRVRVRNGGRRRRADHWAARLQARREGGQARQRRADTQRLRPGGRVRRWLRSRLRSHPNAGADPYRQVRAEPGGHL